MLDGLFKPKFYTKCKSLARLTRTRIETVKRKKNVVCKYLKNDIADLLNNNLDYNAYGRTEGLLDEKKRLSCYDFLEQFCRFVTTNASLLQKSRACPEECREAVSSLIYAAARVSEVPELRDLRSLFTERYGNSLDQFVNQEFVERLQAKPPSIETKLQLLHEIAQEYSINWDSRSLEQRLYRPPPTEHGGRNHGSGEEAVDAGQTWPEQKKEASDNKYRQDISKGSPVASSSLLHGRKSSINEKNKLLYSSGEDESAKTGESSEMAASSSSIGSISEDEQEFKKPFYYRFIPALYTNPKTKTEETISEETSSPYKEYAPAIGAKPKPRSVRRRFAKPPPDDNNEVTTTMMGSSESKQEEMRRTILGITQRDEDSLYPLKPPPSRQAMSQKHVKSDSMDKAGFMNDNFSSEEEGTMKRPRQHFRTISWQPAASMSSPVPPDYDELAARLDALRGK